MPELPEVETTRRGLEPELLGRAFRAVEVRDGRLRQPVPAELPRLLKGRRLLALERRAKYLLFRYAHGTLLIHLGMSGSLRIAPRGSDRRKHDHVCFGLSGGRELRLHDPRRFGFCTWIAGDPTLDSRLAALGPEPLGKDFHHLDLMKRFHGRSAAVKVLIMDPKIVVGIGNIYASETLFRAGIRPSRPGSRIQTEEARRIVRSARAVLRSALRAGGTTLRDFVGGDGEPGQFEVRLQVYGRAGEPCERCAGPIHSQVLGQRMSYWCPRCQV